MVGPTESADPRRVTELAGIISSYNEATEKLLKSHEALGTEVLRLQDELASSDAQLQRSRRLAALGAMAAGIAHEIRNPLAAIQLYAGMLVEDLDGADDSDAAVPPERMRSAATNAEKICGLVRGLNAVVSDVLSFSRDIQPRPVDTDLRAVLLKAADVHRPAIDAAGIDLRIEVPSPTPRVAVDPVLIHQALLNLIRNAVEAMEPAPSRPDDARALTLSARTAAARLIIAVRDTGSGIATEDVDRIFNPFFTTRNTGTGLGLAIVHRIVDAHGGAIAVANDGGAVFTLNLPLAPLAETGAGS